MPSIRTTNARRRRHALRARQGLPIKWGNFTGRRLSRRLSEQTVARICRGVAQILGLPLANEHKFDGAEKRVSRRLQPSYKGSEIRVN